MSTRVQRIQQKMVTAGLNKGWIDSLPLPVKHLYNARVQDVGQCLREAIPSTP